MLSSLRERSGSLISKIFIGLLAASFAVWGVADVFTGVDNAPIAKVGDREVSFEHFRSRFDQRLRLASQNAGRLITPEQARNVGLDRQVLGEVLGQTALEAQASKLKLAISPQAVAQAIADTPEFQTASGEFNRNGFLGRLRANGISEEEFVNAEQTRLARTSIINALQRGIKPPKTLRDLTYDFANEQREARYITVKPDVPETLEPSDSDLKAYYDAHLTQFRVPELRAINILELAPDKLATTITLSDEDIRAEYERRKADFSVPERRQVEQITFPSMAEASAARQQIEAGATFEKIAEERGLKISDISLGKITKSEIADPKIAEAAFSLELNTVSQPVEGRLAVALLRVPEIEFARQEKLEDIKEAIELLAKNDLARDLILDVQDKVEDGRASGQSLADIARDLQLDLISIDGVSRSGQDASGQQVGELTNREVVLSEAFAGDVGIENDVISLRDDTYIWYEITNVIPPASPPLAEIRDKVTTAWIRAQKRKLAGDAAKALVERLRSGESLKKVAEETGSEIKVEVGLKRTTATTEFNSEAVDALFDVAADGATYVVDPDGSEAKVIKSVPTLGQAPDLSSDQYKNLATNLETAMLNDITSEYLAGLQENLGVEINETQWQRARSGQSYSGHQ